MHEDLGIRSGVEPVAARDQRFAQFDVVEDFAVECDPDGFILVVDRLLPAVQVDDTEACMTQTRHGIAIVARAVRPAMTQHAYHRFEQRLIDVRTLAQVADACYTTHDPMPLPACCAPVANMLIAGTSRSRGWRIGTPCTARLHWHAKPEVVCTAGTGSRPRLRAA